MTNLGSFVFIGIAICMLVLFGYLFAVNFAEADSNVKASLIGLLGILSAGLVSHHNTKKREINARLFSEKREAYNQIIEMILYAVRNAEKQKAFEGKQFMNKVFDIKKSLLIWAHQDLILKWHEFESQAKQPTQNEHHVLLTVENIIRELRKDLGHSDTLLKPGALIGLLLIDYEEEMFTDKGN